MKKNKKLIIGMIAIVIIILVILAIVFLQNKQKEKKAKQTLIDFVSCINEKNYEAMYEKVVGITMNKEDFIARNKNIYEGIDSQNIQIEIQKIEKQDLEYQISYHQKMDTAAGEIEFDNQAIMGKQGNEYKVEWSSNFIFPQLENNQKVRIATIKAKRGDILDRNGEKLATDGTILSCGIVPRKVRNR